MSGMLINSYRFAQASNTRLLLHLDSSLIDSTGLHTVETVSTLGTPVYSTSIKKFGSASADIDMLLFGQRYYRTELSSDFDFSSRKQFTLEGFFYISSEWAGEPVLFSNKVNDTYSPFRLQGNKLYVANEAFNNWDSNYTFSSSYTANTWQHWVITGDGNLLKVYRDGVLIASVNYPNWTRGYNTIFDRYLNIGASPSNGGIVGFADEIRYSNIVVYTANFTPPSAPFTL